MLIFPKAEAALQRLPAPGLRGTWSRAYALLTRLVSQIGWDELLKTRSQVFVMEEEYRMQKAQGDIQQAMKSASDNNVGNTASNGAVIHEDGTVVRQSQDDAASTRAMIEPPSPKVEPADPPAIPTIRISTESTRASTKDSELTKVDVAEETDESEEKEEEKPTPKDKGKGKEKEEEGQYTADNASGVFESEKTNGIDVHAPEKPLQAAGEGEQNVNEASPAPTQEPFSFSNKRLCERWLDNLFMVLYEVRRFLYYRFPRLSVLQDLRVWTIFRAEVAHFKTQHVAYRKTGLEWEILGDLGLRLHHKEEAKEAYQRCLDSPRYSVKPWAKLMEMYADEGDIQRCVQTAIRVAAYQYADYTEMSVSTFGFTSLKPLAY